MAKCIYVFCCGLTLQPTVHTYATAVCGAMAVGNNSEAFELFNRYDVALVLAVLNAGILFFWLLGWMYASALALLYWRSLVEWVE